MKTRIIIAVAAAMLFFTGCEDNWRSTLEPDYCPPSVPSGLLTSNGDGEVVIRWTPNYENDLSGYNVYASTAYNGRYHLIGSTRNNYYTDRDAANGVKYYYAVTAYDFDGNESDMSYENVYGIGRPEGYNLALYDYHGFPLLAGYDFSQYKVLAYNTQNTDFYFERDTTNGNYYLVVWNDTDIKDMGTTRDIYDIAYAPTGGWSGTKDAVARPGHTYVIWTWDNHFAKVRINSISRDRVTFDWAYQLVEGEPQLRPAKDVRGLVASRKVSRLQ